MHEGLRQQDGRSTDRESARGSVRIARVDEVAALRRSFPDCAIVAVVGSITADDAIRARLAGADVVLPCADPAVPDPAALRAAREAALVLARRAAVSTVESRRAAHDFAGTSSAVALATQLLEHGDVARRVAQLRELAARGAELAWRGGRAGRSTGPVERVDLIGAVRELCRVSAGEPVAPRAVSTAAAAVVVLVDRVRLATALGQLVDNARRAGAATITVEVRTDGRADRVADVVVTDDGCGLQADRAPGWATLPFTSGWPVPSDGLGLCEVEEFATDHGGGLDLQDRPDGGVVAVLRLPVSSAVPDPAHAPEVTDPPGAGDGGASSRPETEWAVTRILEGVARRAPLNENLEALVATMEEHLPGSSCSILVLDRRDDSLRHGAGSRLPEPYRRAIDGLRIGPATGSCGTAAFLREDVVAVDIATDHRWAAYRDLALPHALRSCWSTPILDVDRGVVLGTFAVYHGVPWVPDPIAIALVRRLTHVAAVAISTAELHARLVESEARFRSTFDATGLGLALVGLDGRLIQANEALASMLDRPVDGALLADLLDPADAAAVDAAMAAARGAVHPADGRVGQAEVRLRRRDADEPLWAALSGSLVRDHAGAARYFSIEVFDLTERRRVAQARRETAVAEAASEAKSDLLALVSHELRTPLNAVIGFAQVLQGMPVTPQQQREGVDHILRAGRHLLRLINDLLDLTGAERGHLHLETAPVATHAAVGEALQIVASLARERSIVLIAPPADPGHHVAADPGRLRQVLLNLLGNAIKYTEPGGRVSVQLAPGRISVIDTGPGIAADELGQLFVPFRRRSTGAESSGLGLALSQRLAGAMDGRLGVRSTPGRGSTFWVDLPVAAPAAAPDQGERHPLHPVEPSGRVLYVEDDPASARLVRSVLSRWPAMSVTTAATCAEARAHVVAGLPDLVLLDVELPDGSGWDLLRDLSARSAAVPAVVVTAGSSTVPPDVAAVDVLGKPLVVDDFLAAISRSLNRSPARP